MPRGHYTRRSRPLVERFWLRVDKRGPVPPHVPHLGPCHVWTAGVDRHGYGRFSRGARSLGVVFAHRAAWEIAHGQIPAGLGVLHACDNPRCVKAVADGEGPAHLFVGTTADNQRDMAAKGRHFSRTKPERLARGERNGWHTRPDRRPVAPRGEAHYATKLTADDVREIRARMAAGERAADVAVAFGICRESARDIATRKRWRHVA